MNPFIAALFNRYGFYVAIAIMVIATVAYQRNELVDLRAYNETLESTLIITQRERDEAISIAESNVAKLSDNQTKLDVLSKSNSKLKGELNEIRSKLDVYRNDEGKVAASPATYQPLVSDATRRVFSEIACETGSTQHCLGEGGEARATPRPDSKPVSNK